MAQRDLYGIGGWLLVFVLCLAAASLLLVGGVVALLREGHFTLGLSVSSLAISGIVLAVAANVIAMVAIGRLAPTGVPLAQRAIILTFYATVHLALLLRVVGVPFLELLLVTTGAMLMWLLYLGLGMRSRKQHFHVDFSRRIAATFPADKRRIPRGARFVYAVILWGYAVYLLTLVWQLASGALTA